MQKMNILLFTLLVFPLCSRVAKSNAQKEQVANLGSLTSQFASSSIDVNKTFNKLRVDVVTPRRYIKKTKASSSSNNNDPNANSSPPTISKSPPSSSPPILLENKKVPRCTDNNNGCSQDCIDYPFGANCTCREGYQLDLRDYRTCIDVDECQLQNGGCQQKCSNTIGTFFCSCAPGFVLGVDMRRCIEIDDCMVETNPCGNDFLCIKTAGPKQCLPSSSFIVHKPAMPILARSDGKPGTTNSNNSNTTGQVLPITTSPTPVTSSGSSSSSSSAAPDVANPISTVSAVDNFDLKTRAVIILLIIWLVILTLVVLALAGATILGLRAVKDDLADTEAVFSSSPRSQVMPQPLTIPRIIETDSLRG